MKKITKLRTGYVKPNNNISFPIGTVLTVKKYYRFLKLSRIFGKYKKWRRDINALIEALVICKLTENQSITKSMDWM